MSSTLQFCKLGVKVSYFQLFITSNGSLLLIRTLTNTCNYLFIYLLTNIPIPGGKDKFVNLTTSEVCENILKPLTATNKWSLCDYLSSIQHDSVGLASVFVSHAWKYQFTHVIDALEHLFRDLLDTIVWFDLFSNNQHEAVNLDFDWWCNTFKSAIGEIKHTVIIFAPWKNPIPLTRGWCLFELYCTIVTGSKLDVAMSKEHRDTFFIDMENDVWASINAMLATIDTKNSECFKEEDKERIFEVVAKEIGFDKVNSLIFETMRDWVIAVTSEEIAHYTGSTADPSPDIKLCKLNHILAQLYRHQGKCELALPICENNVQQFKLLLGDNNCNTLTSMMSLADILTSQQDYAAAIALYEECLSVMKVTYGEHHTDTLCCTNNLANVYARTSTGKYDKAEEMHLYCLDKLLLLHSEDHPSVISTNSFLAYIYKMKNNFIRANELYEDCLRKSKVIFGENHPITLIYMCNLAGCYFNSGNLPGASNLFDICMPKQKILFGTNHPEIAFTEKTYLTEHSEVTSLVQYAVNLMTQMSPQELESYGIGKKLKDGQFSVKLKFKDGAYVFDTIEVMSEGTKEDNVSSTDVANLTEPTESTD